MKQRIAVVFSGAVLAISLLGGLSPAQAQSCVGTREHAGACVEVRDSYVACVYDGGSECKEVRAPLPVVTDAWLHTCTPQICLQ
jgi:hypothetical protein